MENKTGRTSHQGNTATINALESLRNEIILLRNDFGYLKQDVEEVKETTKANMKETSAILDKFRQTLYGNGNSDQPGLVTIVSKLNEWITVRSGIERAVVTALIIGVLTEILGFVFIIIKLTPLK